MAVTTRNHVAKNRDEQGRAAARVQMTPNLSGLCLIPEHSTERWELEQVLRSLRPGIRLFTTSVGVVVSAPDCGALLDVADQMELDWTAEARLFAENRLRACAAVAAARMELKRIRGLPREKMIQELPDLSEHRVLDDHQVRNVLAMCHPSFPGLCVFDEQGAGKTVSFIFAFDLLAQRDEVDKALIIAPKSMVHEWINDFGRFRPGLHTIAALTGSKKERLRALRAGSDVYVTNYEGAISAFDELSAFLRQVKGRACLAVDESFFVKNLDARRTRVIRRLREWCIRGFVLCGTPAPNSPQDLIQQFNVTDFGLTFDGVTIPEDRSAAAPVVSDLIEQRGLYLRHLKQDVLPQLPEKHFHRIHLAMAPRQRELYQIAADNLISQVRAADESAFRRDYATYLARRAALLEICSNPGMVSDSYQEMPAKLRALDELLEDLIVKRGEKVIIWSFYRHSIDRICATFAKFSPIRFDGTIADSVERREAVRRFQEDESAMLFVANPAAAGAGLTLHRSRIAIYESFSNQAAHYLQSLDRIHRRGQERDAEYLILLCDETVELAEYDRLLKKEQAAQDLLGDAARTPPSRDSFLAEILSPGSKSHA